MSDMPLKCYLIASDFDQTLSFHDSGLVLSELVGIPAQEFERKVAILAVQNLVQQGGELSYLLLHDTEYSSRVRREHLVQAGERVRLKKNIKRLCELLGSSIPGYRFDSYVISAGPQEIVESALKDSVPAGHIHGTQFLWDSSGRVESVIRTNAGYGKVAVLDDLQKMLQIGPERIIYVGDGSSDIHVMLHVNSRDGFTIAVSENRRIAQIAKRTVLSDDALSISIPILEEIVGWDSSQIRAFFETQGLLIQEWSRVRTDWVTIGSSASPCGADAEEAASLQPSAVRVQQEQGPGFD
jgi:phosphoserine phosphatase